MRKAGLRKASPCEHTCVVRVQYLPYPVVAGFLGVTGLSIMKGALTITTGTEMGGLADVREAAIAYPGQLAAALLLAATHFALARRLSPGAAFLLLVPSVLLARLEP